jgi:hypothetical protein
MFTLEVPTLMAGTNRLRYAFEYAPLRTIAIVSSEVNHVDFE